MRRTVTLLLLLAALTALADVRTNVFLSWFYETNELAGISFNLYSTTNLSAPNWVLVTNIDSAGLVPTNLMVQVPVKPGNAFYYMTATNQFGESGPSNMATATVARVIGTLQIK